ncbi:MAG: hypothetical protein V1708_05375 [Candidatus Micrarchaeota archaeon]
MLEFEIIFVILVGFLAWQLLRGHDDEGTPGRGETKRVSSYRPEDIRF